LTEARSGRSRVWPAPAADALLSDDRDGTPDLEGDPGLVAPPTLPPDVVPLWFQRGLVFVTAGVVGVGGVGLLLAVLGVYHFAVALVVGGLATIALTAIAWPRPAVATAALATPTLPAPTLPAPTLPAPTLPAGPTRPRTWPAIAMCLVAAGSIAWNAHYAGHHVSIGRDPGVYAVAGKWIALHGNLEVPTGLEWTTKSDHVSVVYEGSYQAGNNHTEFQFDHLTPVLLAEANNLGGDGLMFRVPAVIGALALCAIFAAGCRLVRRPWLVLAAVTGLAVSLPQLNVSRDTFSEPAVELLLWAGMFVLLMAYERARPWMALLAGSALAGTMMSRIDAPMYLVPLPVLAALTWLSTPSGARRRMLLRLYVYFLVGAIPVAVLATLDVQIRGGTYYDDLHSQVLELQRGLSASIVAGALLVLLWPLARPHSRRATEWLKSRRDGIAVIAGSLVVLGMIALWAIRPATSPSHGDPNGLVATLQGLAGLPVDPTRTYAELSVTWLSWYLGPVTIALATVGAAVMLARIVRNPDAAYCLILTVAGLGTGLYLWNPSISPDQIWASRRFVPAALPLFVLLAAFSISVIAESLWSRNAALTRPVLAIGAVALVAFPLATTYPVRSFSPESSFLAGIETTCRATGPDAALLTSANDVNSEVLVGALRTWCGVPVAIMTQPFTTTEIQHLANEWRSDGRTLWVIGSTAQMVKTSAPGSTPTLVASLVSPRELEMTINRPPQHYLPISAPVYAARIQS
jgi:hypothetical protein